MHANGAHAKDLSLFERFFAAIGFPPPPPLTEAERREFDAAIERAEAEARRFYERGAGSAGSTGSARYPDVVTACEEGRAETERMLAAAGVQVTDEGRTRVRAELAALEEQWTPDRRAEANLRFLARVET
jgi:hypothetical protein